MGLFTSSGNVIEEIPKFTKISLQRIAFEHLHMSILVEGVLVDPPATEQEYITVVRDGALC